MSNNSGPPSVLVVEWCGKRLEYHLAKTPKTREIIEDPKTQLGVFQETVMDTLGYMVPAKQTEANKRFYTPMQNLNRQNWFQYLVHDTGKASNSDFQSRWENFKTDQKYSNIAIHAMCRLLTDAQAKLDSSGFDTNSIASLEKTASGMARKSSYILSAMRQISSRNGSGRESVYKHVTVR